MQIVVSIQGHHRQGRSAETRHLAAGQSALFATCGCGRCDYDLVVPTGPGVEAAGRVTAYPDHWRLGNHGAAPLVVTDLEQVQSLVAVPGGRRSVVIPFELARVSAGNSPLVTVFGPEPGDPEPEVSPCPGLATTRGLPKLLDHHTTYFAVLIALCEPRLRQSVDAALPTSTEIAQRLSRRGITLTPRAVDWHIEYVAGKLGVRHSGQPGRARRAWRKEAVASAALRQLLVGPEHLPAR